MFKLYNLQFCHAWWQRCGRADLWGTTIYTPKLDDSERLHYSQSKLYLILYAQGQASLPNITTKTFIACTTSDQFGLWKPPPPPPTIRTALLLLLHFYPILRPKTSQWYVVTLKSSSVPTSLVLRPIPVFQCCTLKNGRAWYAKSRVSRHQCVKFNVGDMRCKDALITRLGAGYARLWRPVITTWHKNVDSRADKNDPQTP